MGWTPLYYLQIALTPGMSFSGEPSITSMRRGVMLPLMKAAGLVEVESHPHGYFPPVLKNTPAGDRAEGWLERRAWVPFPHAFQVFTGRAPA